MQLKRVVITGIGTINPIGNNIAEYFGNLDMGLSGAAPITRFDTTLFKTKFACEIKDYDPENTVSTEKRSASLTALPNMLLLHVMKQSRIVLSIPKR